MASRRKRPRASATTAVVGEDGATASKYEESRVQRIRANKEQMAKLGLLELSLSLNLTSLAAASTKNRPRTSSEKTKPSVQSTPGSPRRSSRIKTMVPVSYVEHRDAVKKGSSLDLTVRIKEGEKPEIYTEEHERALGDCEVVWTMLVDGYGEDGKRIYDAVNGETCHQCRQKTLGLHTKCSECNLVQGQFCGDCLYMRYGENVEEANRNHDWICPVCRDICNCSLCRKVKGWMPTGQIYRKVAKLGYKSVAHYLIQTSRSKTMAENSGAKQDEYSFTGEEPKDLNHDDLTDEDEKMKLLHNEHDGTASEGERDTEGYVET